MNPPTSQGLVVRTCDLLLAVQTSLSKVMQGAGWKIEEVEDPDHMFNLFKHAQVIWAEENPNSQPKNIVYPDKISIELVKNG